ncbi:MAG: ankyrin repeat domain-containing protein [bacterium]
MKSNGSVRSLCGKVLLQVRVTLLLSAFGVMLVNGCASSRSLQSRAALGDTVAVKELLDRGTDINQREFLTGHTALVYAAGQGKLELVKMLLERGAEVDLANSGEHTALGLAALNGHADVARLLVERGASPDKAIAALQSLVNNPFVQGNVSGGIKLLTGLKKTMATPAGMQAQVEQQEVQAKAKLEANLNSYKGMLKTATLLALAGEPAEKLAVTDGEVWIYRYGAPGSGGRFTVTLQIGKDGIVTDWRHNNGPVFVNTTNGLQLLDIPFLK